MKKIIKPPYSGKTTELIRLSAETGATIITADCIRAKHTYKMAHDMGFQIPQPIAFKVYIYARDMVDTTKIHKVLIDDADCCLQSLFDGKEILAIAMDKNYDS